MDKDIWEHIKQEDIKVNPLYAEGYERIGCIGCPFAKHRERIRDFERYPAYKYDYIKAFQRMIEKCDKEEKRERSWHTGEDVFDWWIEKYKYNIRGQMTIDEYLESIEGANETN